MYFFEKQKHPNTYIQKFAKSSHLERLVTFPTFFSCPKEKMPIFVPAISGEIDLARESAFFALFLTSELAHSQM